MITLKQWMELVNYQITEGSDYYAEVKDSNITLYSLNSWDGKQDGSSFFISFDPKTQTVYSAEACDYKNNRAYRLISPLLVTGKEAWDDVDFVDLESDDDFMEKATAIFNGKEYDERVVLPIDIPDDLMFTLMKEAHNQDITFNQLVAKVIEEQIMAISPELKNPKKPMKKEFTSMLTHEDLQTLTSFIAVRLTGLQEVKEYCESEAQHYYQFCDKDNEATEPEFKKMNYYRTNAQKVTDSFVKLSNIQKKLKEMKRTAPISKGN